MRADYTKSTRGKAAITLRPVLADGACIIRTHTRFWQRAGEYVKVSEIGLQGAECICKKRDNREGLNADDAPECGRVCIIRVKKCKVRSMVAMMLRSGTR